MGETIFYGGWATTKSWLKSAKFRATPIYMMPAVRSLGDAIVARLRSHIDKQDLPWEALSDVTKAKKGHDKVYFESGSFKDSLDVEVTRKGAFSLELLVFPKGGHPSSDLSMADIAAYLEYGTTKIPARPIWTPVLEEIKEMPEFTDLFNTAKVGFGS